MKLSTTEILKHLGFDIPSDGIEINSNDAYLTITALRLAGETISTDRIPYDKLAELHRGTVGIFTGWVAQGLVKPISNLPTDSEESLEKLRATVNVLLKITFKRQCD